MSIKQTQKDDVNKTINHLKENQLFQTLFADDSEPYTKQITKNTERNSFSIIIRLFQIEY